MSEKLKKYTFKELLEQGYIRIPRIQRGYAQGRKTKKVEDIRKTFLHTLFQVIKGNQPSAELDFVYGSMKDDAFEPLDGQQRLTTLFLICWMLGIDLKRKDSDKKSVFSYASCPTSEDFCNELVAHEALPLIKEAIKKQTSPSILIAKRDWFHWNWKFDPSISSMLVMIDSIYDELTTDNGVWEKCLPDYRRNIDNITFNELNLGDFGMSNELFIKMNARGKQLSDFDKMKSTLEEEIQIQQGEVDEKDTKLTSETDEVNWRSLMDGKWSDYFWHTYARNEIKNSESEQDEEKRKLKCLVAAKNCEVQFKRLILRLIQLQLHSRQPQSETLREACYKMNASDIDDLLPVYRDSLLTSRSKKDNKVSPSEIRIDFAALINTIESLMVKTPTGRMTDVYESLPEDTHFKCDNINLMQSFLKEQVPNDVALTFYASLCFLEAYPYKDAAEWKSNFGRWIKSLRNILANDNNNSRIDKRSLYEKSMEAISKITADLAEFATENGITTSDTDLVNKFFKSLKDKTYEGLDNSALKEESDKANLALQGQAWKDAIRKAETIPYLWGQIRALIAWAAGDIDKFKSYTSKLADLLELIKEDGNKFYQAALKFDPAYWETSNRLYMLNVDRDNSFKRYLRGGAKDDSNYAPLLECILDQWTDTSSAEEFICKVLADEDSTTPEWIKCIIRDAEILNFSINKKLFVDKGHVVVAQRKTPDSHCIDPVVRYLSNIAKKCGLEKQMMFSDSKGDNPHSLTFTAGNDVYHLKWSSVEGKYDLTNPDGSTHTYSAKDTVDKFSKILTDK